MTSQILERFGITPELQRLTDQLVKQHLKDELIQDRLHCIRYQVEAMKASEKKGMYELSPKMFEEDRDELVALFADLFAYCDELG